MLINYLKIALRNLMKYKSNSIINILGLSLGISIFILIYLYVQNELSYDNFNNNRDRVYRIIHEEYTPDKDTEKWPFTPNPLAAAISKDFSEGELTCRFRKPSSTFSVKYGDNFFNENKFGFSDENFFDMFQIPLISGDKRIALKEIYSVVISEETAKKYFGNDEPIGKSVIVSFPWFGFDQQIFKVTGVVKIPDNFHLKIDFIGSISSLKKEIEDSWQRGSFTTYVLLKKNTNIMGFENRLNDYIKKYKAENDRSGQSYRYALQPLSKIHLSPGITYDSAEINEPKNIYILGTVAFFILLLACINYVNMATSRFSIRTKEIGLRKVIGSSRKSLIFQFLSESILFAVLALAVSIMIVELILPEFNHIVEKKLSLFIWNQSGMNLLTVSVVAILIGTLAGIYPAIYLSSLKPVKILKGGGKSGNNRSGVRSFLIVTQFVITIVLIICLSVVGSQKNYLLSKDLGFNKDNVIILDTKSFTNDNNSYSLKNELLKNPNVISVSVSEGYPGINASAHSTVYPEYYNGKNKFEIPIYRGDFDFIKTYGLEIINGRDFSINNSNDLADTFILNEEAARTFKWEEPIGKRVKFGKNDLTSIGVVKNCHYRSLHENIEPLIICMDSLRWTCYVGVKINGGHIQNTLSYIKDKWNKIYTDLPFDFTFLDENIEKLYKSEEKMSTIFNYSSIITLFITCIGLIGLVTITIAQKTKEVGIRKVLGSSSFEVVILLNKHFMKLVLISTFIAWPVAYYFMNKWLQDFAYRIDLNVWHFVVSTLLAFIIALITVCFQTIKAARANPVDSLKYE
jgi:putative ABC transport system permease protein